ncbi:major facilitator superfamily domain-containing protein [Halenospora varia]|nr:major facilitator superfamily domain-containing protein [Halenospora varia]
MSEKIEPTRTPSLPLPLAAAPLGASSAESEPSPVRHSPQFWMVIVALSLLSFISALDVTIIATALPLITEEIGGATQYVWIANSFVFASAVLQPLIGQLANILGRRTPLITSIILFTLGSGIAGGARNPAMLIGGRTIQGLGAGGIYVLIDIVCCDLVPLRERGKYLAIVNIWAAVAAALGPVVGGLLAQTNWRWIFYINIPFCAISLVAVTLFMRVKTGDVNSKIRDLDYLGNSIFTVSVISLLFGLVTGGIKYPWSSRRVILPIALGTVGWIFFHFHQHFLATNPSVPTRLFSNRTSAAGGVFSSRIFPGCSRHNNSWIRCQLHPNDYRHLIFAMVGGILLSKFGAYRPIHAAMFVLSSLAFGLFTLLDRGTPKVAWAFFELIGASLGMSVSTVLPAVLASLPESDVASASAVFSFIKTFGFVWGVTLPSIIFNAAVQKNLFRVSSLDLRTQLQNGGAYSFASQAHDMVKIVDPRQWSEVVQVYIISLKIIWWLGLGISVVGFFIVGLERGVELSTELKTEYGLDNGEEKSSGTDTAEILETEMSEIRS